MKDAVHHNVRPVGSEVCIDQE
ncbi:hypothetical protein OOU_Y34scaffold00808g1 [Pyricularia oryzae Y34]|uniref:Uncharacterized protein n=1 Tax=Pyricularia oryzae (strain Y34) TaxID=1143189 RepID=A0AA97PGU7_PYRO3|nr:hypothetical protein OOU_Y34scaffold00808g1 [Pyricularia oryzae Y34]